MPERFSEIRAQIEREVAAASDDQILEADPESWANGIGATHQVVEPQILLDEATTEDLGQVRVDCTNMGGISYTSNEMGGPIIRDGRRLQLSIPAEGDLDLFKAQVPGGQLPGTVLDGHVVRTWEWPLVKGTEAFAGAVADYKNQLRARTEALVEKVRSFNPEIAEIALNEITDRRANILKHRDFLGELKVPVKKRSDAHGPIKAPVRRRVTLARATARAVASPEPEPLSGSELDALYEQILTAIRAMGLGLERSYKSFTDHGEETLRDHLLLILNSQFEGQAYAEAFNAGGKTDVLIRIADKNVFIAECKWWDGERTMADALDQLYSYTTWRDSRLALIFFIRAKNAKAIVTKAGGLIARRDEYLGDLPSGVEDEIRCRVHWPGDSGRQATVTIQFFHLPGAD